MADGFETCGVRLATDLADHRIEIAIAREVPEFTVATVPAQDDQSGDSIAGTIKARLAVDGPDAWSVEGAFLKRHDDGAHEGDRVISVQNKLALADGRLRAVQRLGLSRRTTGEGDRVTAVAREFRVDADLWRRGGINLSAFSLFRVVGADYLEDDTGVLADRRTRTHGITLGFDKVTLAIDQSTSLDNVDHDPDVSTLRHLRRHARLTFDLAPPVALLPDRLIIDAERTRVATDAPGLGGDEPVDDGILASTLRLLWRGGHATTELELFHERVNQRVPGATLGDLTTDEVSFSHSFNRTPWTLSADASAARIRETNITDPVDERRLGLAAELLYQPDTRRSMTLETRLDLSGGAPGTIGTDVEGRINLRFGLTF
ncbi:MAG: hypothetical protein ACE5H8_15945 [Alphaproteobacteria bacterium]